MEFIKTKIEDLIIIKPSVHEDGRGYFMETFKESIFKDKFPHINFIQDNDCLLYTSPSPRDTNPSRMPSSA